MREEEIGWGGARKKRAENVRITVILEENGVFAVKHIRSWNRS